ncbi:MAG: transglutaminase family protein, partial [Anaerolineales bacterium]|nr:transglutaminase family protein [Anaerolineales bacterium]
MTSALITLSLLLQLFIPALGWPRETAAYATDTTKQTETTAITTVTQPDTLANPISIARAQSSYQAGGDLTITYTVRNNHSAANLPEIAPGLNVTDTVAALSGFDPLADPNTLHNVIVSAALTNGTTFLDGSIWPDTDGSQLLFALGDIAPRADATFTVTISAPTTAADFLELDGGAMVYSTFQGRMATAVAPRIRLAPDGFANWLIKTPDADRDDEAMRFQAAQIGDDPLALFDFVQHLSYEAYDGSLRGTRGTLWSAAGNSADQASLLIAMLRSVGIPARYRHGDLPLANAQALIASMFADPSAIRGNVPAGTAVSDPINDPELLAFTQDHWWVEAYLPGSGWTDLDPTIAAAAPGALFAVPATDGSDQIAELPDAIRHKLAFTLDVEKYGSFPIGGLNLTRNTVLTATIPTAQAAGVPVKIAFSVQSQTLNGLIFSSAEHTYTPYLTYGDSAETIFGSAFQDLLTSFPLATHYTTAIWLDVTSTAPDGRSDTYQRTIKDLVGVDVRQGGSVQLEPRGDAPLIKSSDLIQVQPIPNSAYPSDEANRIIHSLFHQVPTMIAAYNAYSQLDDASPPADIFAFTDDQLPALYDAQFTQLDLMSALFQYSTTWEGEAINAETMLVKSYPDRPKLILGSQIGFDDGSLQTSFELLNLDERAIGYPGQNLAAVKSANFLRTSSEKTQEYELLERFLPGEARSAVGTLVAAAEQGIPTHFITAENLADLNDLNIPAETKARIATYVSDGSLVAVPEQMVSMPYGEDIGFMVVAPDGNASYVNADGYMASIMYALLNTEVIVAALIEGAGLASVGGFMAYIFTFFAEAFIVFLDLPPTGLGNWPSAIAGGGPGGGGKGLLLGLILASKAALITTLGACGISPNPPGCQLGSLAGYGFVVTGVIAALVGGALDPSLPDFWVSDLPLPEPTRVSTMTLTAVPTLSGPVTLNITAGHYWSASSSLSSNWNSSHTQTAPFDTLSAAAVDVSGNGTPLGSGSLAATDGRIQFNAAAHQWTLTGSAAAAGYAPAASGLAVAQVGDYTATASGSPNLTGQLRSATATLNETPVAGTLDVVFNSDAMLTGSGAAPSPHFATAHTLELTQGQFIASDIAGGTISVGGTAVHNIQSLAFSSYTGDVALSDSGDVDQINLNGAANFFAITAAADTSNASVNDGILITPDLLSNYSDTYTVTVSVPDGWTTGAISSGILVTPTAKAETGSAAVLITAQSAAHPDLFSSAIVSFTLAENQAVDVTVVPDPLVTVPMGTVQGSEYDLPLTLNHAGDGRAEIPGAAFNVRVRNDSTAAATFNLSVAGLPAGWAAWSQGSGDQTSLTLGAGARQTIGLYVVPPAAPLPAAGTS